MIVPTIRIVIANEEELVRVGLAALFERQPGMQVVGDAADGLEAIERATTLSPDVMILSALLPKLDGVATAQRIRKQIPSAEIVLLSGTHDEERMRQAFGAGIRAYLLKTCRFEELCYAVRCAARGEYYLSGPAGQDVISEFVRPVVNAQRPGGIMTQRERELARLLADGYSTKEAADILNISPKTAETHRASIMKKLNARNVTDIVKYCIRTHLIEP